MENRSQHEPQYLLLCNLPRHGASAEDGRIERDHRSESHHLRTDAASHERKSGYCDSLLQRLVGRVRAILRTRPLITCARQLADRA